MQTGRRIAAFDVDGTLADSIPVGIAFARKAFGVEPVTELLRSEGITRAYPMLDDEQRNRLYRHPWENPAHVPPKSEHLKELFDAVRDTGYERAILTASYGDSESIIRWLGNQRLRPGLEYEHFWHVKRARDKVNADAAVLIDDSIITGDYYGQAGKPYFWCKEDVAEDVIKRVSAYNSVFVISDLSEVPRLLAGTHPESARFEALLRNGSETKLHKI